jgi:hypothetical protein
MRDLHLPTQPSPPILLERYRRNAVMALEPGQGRKTAALRDAHQVPLLTGSALFCLEFASGIRTVKESLGKLRIQSFHRASRCFAPRARFKANAKIEP